MTKKFGFVLLAAFILALMPARVLLACTVNCGTSGSCSGTASCECNENGKPSCLDQATLTAESLDKQADYARSFNTPGLNRFADAVQKMADAMTRGDQDSYFIGVLQREDALKSLSAKERRILNSWDGGDSKPTGPAQK